MEVSITRQSCNCCTWCDGSLMAPSTVSIVQPGMASLMVQVASPLRSFSTEAGSCQCGLLSGVKGRSILSGECSGARLVCPLLRRPPWAKPRKSSNQTSQCPSSSLDAGFWASARGVGLVRALADGPACAAIASLPAFWTGVSESWSSQWGRSVSRSLRPASIQLARSAAVLVQKAGRLSAHPMGSVRMIPISSSFPGWVGEQHGKTHGILGAKPCPGRSRRMCQSWRSRLVQSRG